MNRSPALVWTLLTAWPLATANAGAAAARDSIVDPPVVYTVTVDGPPDSAIAVSATFPGSPDSVMMSTWSSFAFPEGWSALVRDVVTVKDGDRRPLARGPDGTWNPGTSDESGPLTIEYTVELAPVFAEYESLPKTTAPWTDGPSLVIPGFCLFMHAPGQSRFVLHFEVPEGARVDTGWSVDASDGSFHGASQADAQPAWIRPSDDASPSARRIAASVAGVAPVDAESLQDRIERSLAPLASDTTPGAVVVVTHDCRVIAEHAVGMANLEHGVPLDADSVFHVASDAKRFTAAAICRLAERGHLALDDLVSEHIPEAAPLGQRITIEQLLCHSSGVKDQWSLLAMAGWRPEDIVAQEQVVDMLCRQRSTNFEPGDRQMYSNSGYTLLAEIVSRVTGTGLGDFLEREFFVPCGMTRTRLRTSVSEVVPGRVDSYLPDEDGTYVRRPVQYEVLGATSLLTTARDLSRWIDAVHADDGALSRIELETMLSPRRLPSGDLMTYAFGLFEHRLHGLTAIGHGGADGGFRSYFLRIPERRLGVVVLANTPKIEPNGLAHRIAEWALGFEPPPADDASSGERRPSDLSGFVSTYRDADGHVVTVRKWFDKLRLWEGGAAPAEFTWQRHDERFVDPAGRVLGFDDGHCHVTTGGRTWTGARIPGPDAEALRECEGVYISEELGAMLELTVEDAVLVARSPRGPRITLTPSGRDFFDGDTWYCFEARLTRDPEGRVQSLLLSSSRAFDVPFRRQPGRQVRGIVDMGAAE